MLQGLLSANFRVKCFPQSIIPQDQPLGRFRNRFPQSIPHLKVYWNVRLASRALGCNEISLEYQDISAELERPICDLE